MSEETTGDLHEPVALRPGLLAAIEHRADGVSTVELVGPAKHRLADRGDRFALLGFPASPQRTPWSRLGSVEREHLLAGVADGTTQLQGSWTLIASEGDGLLIRTDRFGTRPLFWCRTGTGIEVAETIWPLLARSTRLDPVGVADFLFAGLGLGERTFFDGIYVTEPDTTVRFSADGISVERGRWPPPVEVSGGLSGAVDALDEHLGRLLDPYGDLDDLLVLLSGGLDSRVLLALAAERNANVLAQTITFFENSDEERISKAVARVVGVPHVVDRRRFESLNDHALDFVRGTSAQLSLEHIHAHGPFAEEAPAMFNVMVNGVWGDMVLGHSLLFSPNFLAQGPEEAGARYLVGGKDPRRLAEFLPGVPEWEPRVRELVSRWYSEVGGTQRVIGMIAARNRPARFNVWAPFPEAPERGSVTPFFDEDLHRICYGMDQRWHANSTAYRQLIRRRWPKLGRIPWQKTGLPLARYPNRFTARRRRLARRLGYKRQSAFTDPARYLASLDTLVEVGERSLSPRLAEIGIDVPRLLETYPQAGGYGRALRLRLATLHLVLSNEGDA